MGLSIYKPGQGYWTRVMSAVGAGALTLAGVLWLWQSIIPRFVSADSVIYVRTGVAIGLIAVLGGLIYYLIGLKPRIADFMIATEAEMKKVNWPSWHEILGSTWIVICGTFLIAAVLFVIDLFFGWFFIEINILAPTGGS